MTPPSEPPQDGIYLVFTSALREGLHEWTRSGRQVMDYTQLRTPQSYICEALLETLKDPAVRREVYEHANDQHGLDQVSMMDVQSVMDGLVSVLYPTTTEDPTTTEEQEVGSNRAEDTV